MVADTLEQPQARLGTQPHHAAIAEVDVQLLRTGILGFADRQQTSLFHQQAPVRPRFFAMKPGNRHGRAVNQRLTQLRQGLRADQR
ncbi:hypothetical protein D3C84_1059720 [compost metagenome]